MAQTNIREMELQDREQMAALYNLDADTCRWLFKGSVKIPVLGYIAETNAKIVAAYIKIPHLLKIGDKIIVAYCGGPIVAEGCRGNWVYPRLALKVFSEVKRYEGVVYGFPNRVITFLIKKVLMKPIKEIPEYAKIFTPGFLVKRKFKNRLISRLFLPLAWLKLIFRPSCRMNDPGDIEIRKIDIFDEKINYFWDKVSSGYPIILVRNKEYLNWRYVEEPHKKNTIFIAEKEGEVLGYIVLNIMQRNEGDSYCAILDLLTIKDESVILKLLSFTINFLLNEKVDAVTFLTSDSFQVKALNKLGFVKSKYSKKLIAVAYTPNLDVSFFLNPGNWFVTGGETRYA